MILLRRITALLIGAAGLWGVFLPPISDVAGWSKAKQNVPVLAFVMTPPGQMICIALGLAALAWLGWDCFVAPMRRRIEGLERARQLLAIQPAGSIVNNHFYGAVTIPPPALAAPVETKHPRGKRGGAAER